jgi:hypothetical protein
VLQAARRDEARRRAMGVRIAPSSHQRSRRARATAPP